MATDEQPEGDTGAQAPERPVTPPAPVAAPADKELRRTVAGQSAEIQELAETVAAVRASVEAQTARIDAMVVRLVKAGYTGLRGV